jgi:glycoside/pentoside/hexuronide:cation symporter, GPH family
MMASAAVQRWRYLAYGLLGMPLAMAALPVYLQVPAYYTTHLGLAIGSTGWVLFLTRLVDTVQDPWLGRCIDRLSGIRLQLWMIAGALLLGLSFCGLWLPPVWLRGNGTGLLVWLGLMLLLVYLAHSMLNIAYLSWGARLSSQTQGLLGASASREAAGLVGAIVASVTPSLIMAGAVTVEWQLTIYAGGFAVVLGLAVAALLGFAPPWNRAVADPVQTSELAQQGGWAESMAALSANRAFRRLLLPYFLNAISVAIPATLALFFINDHLQAAAQSGALLALYFLSTAIGLPCWVLAARRLGVLQAWRLGMLLAMLAFSGTIFLQAGDVLLYGVICIAAGLALGADLALPPVLLAGMIDDDARTAAYYGVWTLLAKLALAVSGLTLPLLALLGYQPGMTGNSALAWVYAVLPCGFKLLALLLSATLRETQSELPANALP